MRRLMPLSSLAYTAPTASGNTTLYADTPGKVTLADIGAKQITFRLPTSHAGTLEVYSRGPVTDRLLASVAFSGSAQNRVTVNILGCSLIFARWTNGGTNQTIWEPQLEASDDVEGC